MLGGRELNIESKAVLWCPTDFGLGDTTRTVTGCEAVTGDGAGHPPLKSGEGVATLPRTGVGPEAREPVVERAFGGTYAIELRARVSGVE